MIEIEINTKKEHKTFVKKMTNEKLTKEDRALLKSFVPKEVMKLTGGEIFSKVLSGDIFLSTNNKELSFAKRH